MTQTVTILGHNESVLINTLNIKLEKLNICLQVKKITVIYYMLINNVSKLHYNYDLSQKTKKNEFQYSFSESHCTSKG